MRQSVSQAGKQSVGQSVGQASRQAGKNTQLGFFSVADYNYKHWGTHCAQEHSAVEWSNTRPINGPTPVRIPASGSPITTLADQHRSPIIYSTLVQVLLTTNF